MGYFISFTLVYLGYTLIDWGHYVMKHEKVPMWYLLSGKGDAGDITPQIGKGIGPSLGGTLGSQLTAASTATKANVPTKVTL